MKRRFVSAVHQLLFAVTFIALGIAPASGQTFFVSVPKPSLANGERIVAFEIHVRAGRVVSLPNVPIGWYLEVDNNPSWNTVVKGNIQVGAAAVDARFLRDLLIVEGEPDPREGRRLSLDGEIVMTSDFSTEKTIKLSSKDFV